MLALRSDLAELSSRFADELDQLQTDFMLLAATGAEEAIVLVLRFTAAPPASVPESAQYGPSPSAAQLNSRQNGLAVNPHRNSAASRRA